jgi:hypothetical protein
MQRVRKVLLTTLCGVLIVFMILSLVGTTAHAAGLIDETINEANEYSKYSLLQYGLDFHADSSWNIFDNIGKSVMYAIYMFTNVLWLLSGLLSSATGFVVQEAYKLDFIAEVADVLGKNIQALAGINEKGLQPTGFFPQLLLWVLIILGGYVAYVGMIKKAMTKAMQAVINLLLVFFLGGAFIAGAPTYVAAINEFSSDLSTQALTVGVKIMLPDSGVAADSEVRESTDLIRDSLFGIQIKKPWLLLQFGRTDIENERVESLLGSGGEEREEIVKKEIEDGNQNLSVGNVGFRLATTLFLLIFNLGISAFVLFLCGIMIFSQVLFVIYATFLPISFLLGMLPGFQNTWQKAITRLFNAILMRTGLTMIISVAFSLASMLYSISGRQPFFLIAFFQIATFGGVYFSLGKLLSMFSLESRDTTNLAGRFGQRTKQAFKGGQRNIQNTMNKRKKSHGQPKVAQKPSSQRTPNNVQGVSGRRPVQTPTQSTDGKKSTEKKTSMGGRAGRVLGTIADMPSKIKDKGKQAKENVKAMPTNARYAAHKAKGNMVNAAYQMKDGVRKNVKDFKGGIRQTRAGNELGRELNRKEQRQTVDRRRTALEREKEAKRNVSDGIENGTEPQLKQKHDNASADRVKNRTKPEKPLNIDIERGSSSPDKEKPSNSKSIPLESKSRTNRRDSFSDREMMREKQQPSTNAGYEPRHRSTSSDSKGRRI